MNFSSRSTSEVEPLVIFYVLEESLVEVDVDVSDVGATHEVLIAHLDEERVVLCVQNRPHLLLIPRWIQRLLTHFRSLLFVVALVSLLRCVVQFHNAERIRQTVHVLRRKVLRLNELDN